MKLIFEIFRVKYCYFYRFVWGQIYVLNLLIKFNMMKKIFIIIW